jgi:hypothetical protein
MYMRMFHFVSIRVTVNSTLSSVCLVVLLTNGTDFNIQVKLYPGVYLCKVITEFCK